MSRRLPGPVHLPPPPGVYWAVFATGPHRAYHLRDLYTARREARAEAARLLRDGFHDGVVVARVEFGRGEETVS